MALTDVLKVKCSRIYVKIKLELHMIMSFDIIFLISYCCSIFYRAKTDIS